MSTCPKCASELNENGVCPNCEKTPAPVPDTPVPSGETPNPESVAHPDAAQTSTPVQAGRKPNTKTLNILIAASALVLLIVVAIVSVQAGKNAAKKEIQKEIANAFGVTTEENTSASDQQSEQVDSVNIKKAIADAKNLIDTGKYMDAFDLLHDVASTDETEALRETCRKKLLEPYEGKFDVDNEDEMADFYWIYAPNASDKNYLYISRSKKDDTSIKLCLYSMHVHSTSDGLIFQKGVRVKGDSDLMLDAEVSYSDHGRETANRKYYEWINIVMSDEEAQTMTEILKDTTSLTIRHMGSNLHGDNKLTTAEISDMQKVADYYNLLIHLYS